MSDEYQPNEVVESQPELEGMTLEPMPEPVTVAPEPVLEMPGPIDVIDISPVPVEAIEPEVAVPGEVEPVVVDETLSGPSIVSIADIEASKPSFGDKIGVALTEVGSLLHGRGWLVGGIVLALLLISLFLPPISLAQRLSMGGGYEMLDEERPFVEHSDGLKITVDTAEVSKLRVKLSTIPRAEFTADALPKDMLSAFQALPAHLTPKSPYYMVAVRGKERGPATLDIVIPNESEPWETLDLYAWDSEEEIWRWVPARLDRDGERLYAEVSTLPSSIMVMQSSMTQQKIAAEVNALSLSGAEVVLTEVDVPGMLIGTIGGLTGDATQLPLANQGGNVAVAPLVRNWVPGRDPNWALVSDMLNMEADRKTHVENLVGLVKSGGYGGLVLDYRSLLPRDREVYAAFVNDLATAFHEESFWLTVVVDTPQLTTDGSWDTGGYDWSALGGTADQLRVVMPLDPQVYAPGGVAEQMLEWAISQVDRYKLMLVYSTLSTDGSKSLTFDEVLSPLGNIAIVQPVTESVKPGTSLSFKLGATANIETDGTTGATRITVGDKVYWLGSAQWLRSRLDLVARYHLGGVVLRDLLSEGNAANLLPAVADYQAQIPSPSYALPEITWQVTDPKGQAVQSVSSLTQPQFAWVAPTVTGTYSIAARVAGADKGSVSVLVAEPAPVVTETFEVAEEEEDEEGTSAALTEPLGSGALKAAFVTDVTVPDNTRFEKGEAFVKTWRLKNAGTTPWPKETVLAFASGEQMGDVKQVEVGEVAAGDTIDISVDMVAPDKDGTFKGVWQLSAGNAEIEGGGVMVIIKVGEAQAAAPVVVAPASSGGFELGGHVRDMGIPYKDTMHYAGMNWAKVQVHYAEDAAWIVNVAHAAGFKIQLSALGGPAMVTEAGFEQKFATWVAGLAKSGADAIEVWNEPNIEREWQIGYISPEAYKNLLCASYTAIKAANAGTAVISAAPAPTGWFGGCGPNGCDDQPWMEGLYNAGAANCMDYIGARHNAGATSPSARVGHPANPGDTHHSWFFLPQTELYYNIFRGTRQLFYTEMGYASQEGVPTFSDDFAWARGTNNAEQAAWLAEAVQLGINTGMVRCIIVWNIDFVRYGYDPQDGFAIIRPGGSCPACETLHNVLGTR